MHYHGHGVPWYSDATMSKSTVEDSWVSLASGCSWETGLWSYSAVCVVCAFKFAIAVSMTFLTTVYLFKQERNLTNFILLVQLQISNSVSSTILLLQQPPSSHSPHLPLHIPVICLAMIETICTGLLGIFLKFCRDTFEQTAEMRQGLAFPDGQAGGLDSSTFCRLGVPNDVFSVFLYSKSFTSYPGNWLPFLSSSMRSGQRQRILVISHVPKILDSPILYL